MKKVINTEQSTKEILAKKMTVRVIITAVIFALGLFTFYVIIGPEQFESNFNFSGIDTIFASPEERLSN
jgi:hypothetical protein